MKIQINITDSTKEIIIEDSCNFKELAAFLQTSFPDYYHEFKIVPKIIKNFGAPIIINPYTQPYWRQPWYVNGSPYVGDTSNVPYKLTNGHYNVEFITRHSQTNTNTEL